MEIEPLPLLYTSSQLVTAKRVAVIQTEKKHQVEINLLLNLQSDTELLDLSQQVHIFSISEKPTTADFPVEIWRYRVNRLLIQVLQC